MSVTLNHTIVWCRDKTVSAAYLAETLGLAAPVRWGPFMIVDMGNGVSLDYHDVADPSQQIAGQHYAFLVSEEEFDEIYGRIVARDQQHWADPGCSTEGINHNDGGRGTYFADPDGHLLEIITRPYGSGG
jgi:catechol 2,3-dioxygenase-like lactoylglutathione lyase family enzyme